VNHVWNYLQAFGVALGLVGVIVAWIAIAEWGWRKAVDTGRYWIAVASYMAIPFLLVTMMAGYLLDSGFGSR
jgi:hypothetical protein